MFSRNPTGSLIHIAFGQPSGGNQTKMHTITHSVAPCWERHIESAQKSKERHFTCLEGQRKLLLMFCPLCTLETL